MRLTALLLAAGLAAHAAPEARDTDPFPPPLPPEDQASEPPGPPPPPPDDVQQTETSPTPEALPPAQSPDLSSFERGLGPYGRWVDTPEYGRVWIPNGITPDWQPYTNGRWVLTKWGWSFVSADPWGWAVFHYGRWGFAPARGWFWVPGFVWAPAWVFWRIQAGYVCWAPFGPRGYRFGPGWHGWVVVPAPHFTHPIPRHVLPRPWASPIVRGAEPAPSIKPGRVRGFYGPPRSHVRPIPRTAPRGKR